MRTGATFGLVLAFLSAATPVAAAVVPLTILHTNDVHSHYRPTRGAFGLGGVARIATTLRRERARAVNSLVLDGGDWSEGSIYYNLDAGRASLQILNALGYDAAVVGNHDWLNGPDQLLKILTEVPLRFPLLGANLDFSKYARGAELSRLVQPSTMLSVGGLKIGVIGLCTYELIYDRFVGPVEIKDPFSLARRLAASLKAQGADLVIVISHNGLATNKLVAGLPNVDIVIHAHDHVKLPEPIVVEQNGKQALLVEAHRWGDYVGKLEILFDTDTRKWSLKHYELIQQDSTVPDDPVVAAMVDGFEHELTLRYGDIFHDHLADANIDVRMLGSDNLWGNLLTDAYREATGADVAFEQVNLSSDGLYRGELRTVDLYNALTEIWNPATNRAWTLKTMKMTGETLSWIMNFVLSANSYVPGGILSVSGLHAVYDPLGSKGLERDPGQALRLLEIGGYPVEKAREYLVALPEGINESLDFVESFSGSSIPRIDYRDTGIEDWRVVADYVHRHSPIDTATIGRSGRLEPVQPDLAIYYDEVAVTRSGRELSAVVTVRNLGAARSGARTLNVTYDRTPLDTRDDPNPFVQANDFDVPGLAPGAAAKVSVRLSLPAAFAALPVPVYFELSRDENDVSRANDGTWLLVEPDGKARQPAL